MQLGEPALVLNCTFFGDGVVCSDQAGYQAPRTVRHRRKGVAATREAMLEARLSPGVTPATKASAAENVS